MAAKKPRFSPKLRALLVIQEVMNDSDSDDNDLYGGESEEESDEDAPMSPRTVTDA